MQSFRVRDGGLAWTGELACGLEGAGINCYSVLRGDNPAGGSGCKLSMSSVSDVGWHHFFMGDTNSDSYLYLCNGAQYSSGGLTHRFWFRERK
jgi:hypothetical protein